MIKLFCFYRLFICIRIILDRVADSLVIEDYDFDDEEEDEDISDISEDDESNVLKRKRELIDELVEKAEGDETFSRVLSELSGYQPAITESRRKSVALTHGGAQIPQTSSTASASASAVAKKRSRPATSGSRFNRLSALTQAMRTGIISDDEGSNLPANQLIAADVTDSEDLGFDGEETELSHLKKVRTVASGATQVSSLPNTPIKEEAALKVIPVPYDDDRNPILPLSLNMITVHRLGEVIYDRPAYHNKRYILPIGFTTSRSYLSVISPEATMNYFSSILDNGPAPIYQVTPEGHAEMAFQSTSTTGAWAAVAKAAAAIRGKDTAPSVSGPDYFGLANPTVSMLIERLPNADKCESYAPKKYEVSNLVGGKTAKSTLPHPTISSASTATATVTVTLPTPVHIEIDNDEKQEQDAFDIHQNYM